MEKIPHQLIGNLSMSIPSSTKFCTSQVVIAGLLNHQQHQHHQKTDSEKLLTSSQGAMLLRRSLKSGLETFRERRFHRKFTGDLRIFTVFSHFGKKQVQKDLNFCFLIPYGPCMVYIYIWLVFYCKLREIYNRPMEHLGRIPKVGGNKHIFKG